MIKKKKYSIEEVFNLIGKEYLMLKNQSNRRFDHNDLIIDGYKVRRISLRYMTFYQKGTDCVCCGRKGSYFLLEEGNKHNPERKHFNLYTEDGILLTKDHIIPKSKNGKNNVDNMQTMCIICNQKKKDKIIY